VCGIDRYGLTIKVFYRAFIQLSFVPCVFILVRVYIYVCVCVCVYVLHLVEHTVLQGPAVHLHPALLCPLRLHIGAHLCIIYISIYDICCIYAHVCIRSMYMYIYIPI